VGLVLSGGSARGFAHVGVIKVLEERGIVVDVITGTSMGSIIGGMYATGYGPELMLEVAGGADWEFLFNDAAARENLPFERKAEVGGYVFTLPIRDGRPRLPGGFIAGQRIGQFLGLLTWQEHPVRSFAELPVSYAAVATDAETGDAVRLDHGFLPRAIRASMAIPTVFEPVEIEGRLLTDGGVARNLPAEDALALGADVLICSDVSKPLLPADSLGSLLTLLDQTMSYRSWESTLKQRELCDVLILPNIAGLSSTAFDKAVEWAQRGEDAAREAITELATLVPTGGDTSQHESVLRMKDDPAADSVYIAAIEVVGLEETTEKFVRDRLKLGDSSWVQLANLNAGVSRLFDTGRFRYVEYRLEAPDRGSPRPDLEAREDAGTVRVLELRVEEQSYAALGISYRYESRYKASLLVSAVATELFGQGSRIAGDLRIGDQAHIGARASKRFGHGPELILGAEAAYRRMPFDIYEGDLRISTPRSYVTDLALNVGLGLGNAIVLAGRIKAEHADNDEFAAVESVDSVFKGESQTFYTLGAALVVDSYDRPSFPRAGVGALAKGEWADRSIGSGLTFRHYTLDVHGAVPAVGRRLSFLGRLTLGASSGEVPDHYVFFLGGTNGYYLFPDRQFPLAGLRVLQRNGLYVQMLQLGIQYEVHRNVLGRFRWNAGATMDEWRLDSDLLTYGFDLTLATVTRFGSAALALAALDLRSLPRVVIDVGFPF
jgi:NTE family protein